MAPVVLRNIVIRSRSHAVALVERPPDPAARRHITETHQRLGREVTGAAALHCAYVSRGHLGDGAYRHWTWAFGELF